MDLLEIGAIAQLLGAVAILLSLIFVIIELRKNLKQNNIANTLVRAIERDELNYMQMDESMAKLIAKARSSYKDLKSHEKVQFDDFVLQKITIEVRGYRYAEESAFKFGTSRLRERLKINTSEFFASIGVRECYDSLLERNLINDQPLLCEIVDDLNKAFFMLLEGGDTIS